MFVKLLACPVPDHVVGGIFIPMIPCMMRVSISIHMFFAV